VNLRLQKLISQAGVASRRAAEKLIAEGRVTVNGETVTEMGTKADPARDDIRVDGRRIKATERLRYILLYKPAGYVTTRSDPQHRRTVIDLLRGVREYCQAYHGAPNRQEIIDELVNTKTTPTRVLLEKYPWPARSPNGKINVASMLDINKWYVKSKMSAQEFPADRVIDGSFIDRAVAKLGPFELQNKDSKLPGCR